MNNELIHYGVKGMHWGVRRYQNYDGTLKNAGKKRTRKETALLVASPAAYGAYKGVKSAKNKIDVGSDTRKEKITAAKEAAKVKRAENYSKSIHAKTKSLTDAELEYGIKRLKLEKEYRSLSNADKAAGRAAARGVVAEYGMTFVEDAGRSFSKDLAGNTGKYVSRKIVPHQKNK